MRVILLGISFCVLCLASNAQKNRVLFVLSSDTTFNNMPNGSYLPEVTLAYAEFVKAGYKVDVVTPAGHAAALYMKGDTSAELKKISHDKMFRKTVREPLTPGLVRGSNYWGVYFPGGYGQYKDVAGNRGILSIVGKIHQDGGFIGASSHGCASVIKIINDNVPLCRGKEMTIFPTWAELDRKEAAYGDLLPFNAEKDGKQYGAKLKICTRHKQNDTTWTRVNDVENRLITASFPQDAKWVSKQMIAGMKAALKPRDGE